MRKTNVIVALAAVALTATVTRTVVSQDNSAEAWAKLAAPGPEHKKLEPLVGTFEASSKMWYAPGQAPTESKGTCENKWILGGRYVQQTYTSSFNGQTYEGLGLWGYDNGKKKFTNVWIDSASTVVQATLGDCDSSGKVISSVAESDKMKVRSVVTIVSNDKHT